MALDARKPFVSVIIPTFNRAGMVLRAVSSVVRQSYPHWEIVLVDDGSTDETSQVIEWYRKRCLDDGNIDNACKIKVVKLLENLGVAKARNQAIAHSSGEWIAFLDSDDKWLPEKLEKQIELAMLQPELGLIHHDEIWIRHGVREEREQEDQKSGGNVFEQCLNNGMISLSTAIVRRSLLVDMQGLDENFQVCDDYDLLLKITSLYPVGFMPAALAIRYEGHSDQLSLGQNLDAFRVKSLKNILNIRKLDPSTADKVKRVIVQKSQDLNSPSTYF